MRVNRGGGKRRGGVETERSGERSRDRQSHTHTHTHTQSHNHTHTYTQSHTHTYTQPNLKVGVGGEIENTGKPCFEVLQLILGEAGASTEPDTPRPLLCFLVQIQVGTALEKALLLLLDYSALLRAHDWLACCVYRFKANRSKETRQDKTRSRSCVVFGCKQASKQAMGEQQHKASKKERNKRGESHKKPACCWAVLHSNFPLCAAQNLKNSRQFALLSTIVRIAKSSKSRHTIHRGVASLRKPFVRSSCVGSSKR